MIKITGGIYKSRKLKEFKGRDIRPVTSIVREAFFNIFDVFDATFLDLFAGSGIMGIEALSRGAEHVVFVDISTKALTLIKSNLEMLKIPSSKYTILKLDVLNFLIYNNSKFDFVFFDPPFPVGNWYRAFSYTARFLNEDSVSVIKKHKKESLPKKLGLLNLFDVRNYGSSGLGMFSL